MAENFLEMIKKYKLTSTESTMVCHKTKKEKEGKEEKTRNQKFFLRHILVKLQTKQQRKGKVN